MFGLNTYDSRQELGQLVESAKCHGVRLPPAVHTHRRAAGVLAEADPLVSTSDWGSLLATAARSRNAETAISDVLDRCAGQQARGGAAHIVADELNRAIAAETSAALALALAPEVGAGFAQVFNGAGAELVSAIGDLRRLLGPDAELLDPLAVLNAGPGAVAARTRANSAVAVVDDLVEIRRLFPVGHESRGSNWRHLSMVVEFAEPACAIRLGLRGLPSGLGEGGGWERVLAGGGTPSWAAAAEQDRRCAAIDDVERRSSNPQWPGTVAADSARGRAESAQADRGMSA